MSKHDHDPFSIADTGISNNEMDNAITDIPVDSDPTDVWRHLGLDTPTSPEEAREFQQQLCVAERQFCWSPKGVGIYSGRNDSEMRAWDYLLRRYADSIKHDDPSAQTLRLDVTRVISPSQLMPSEEEARMESFSALGFGFRTGKTDLATALTSIVKQTSLDIGALALDGKAYPAVRTFLLTMPQPPEDVAHCLQFEAAYTAKNPSASDLHEKSLVRQYDALDVDRNEPEGDKLVKILHKRLKAFYDQCLIDYQPEEIPSKLNAIGLQTSRSLALGLQYLYYRRILDFVDIGSGYRNLHEGIRAGILAPPCYYDLMMAGADGYGYATLTTDGSGNEAALGGYAVPPTGNRELPDEVAISKIQQLKEAKWDRDPLSDAITAALLYAKYELPGLPTENLGQ